MISFVAEVVCSDCGAVFRIGCTNINTVIAEVRKNGWAVARDRCTCYCPECAVARRNVGCGGGKKSGSSLSVWEHRHGFKK